jgi:hypothetical protein
VNKGEFFTSLRHLEGNVFSQVPLAGVSVSCEDFEVDGITIWADVRYTAIFRPCDLSVEGLATSLTRARFTMGVLLAAPTGS